MKLKLFIFFSLFVSFSLLLFLALLDKTKINDFVQNEISEKFGKNISFSDEIKFSIFPQPKVTLKNLMLRDNSNLYQINIKKVLLHSNWKLIFKKEFKIKNIELIRPDIGIDLTKKKNFLKHNINYNQSNFLEDLNIKLKRYFTYFDSLKLSDGKINLFLNNSSEKFNFNMKVLNKKETKIFGNIKINKFNSDILYDIETTDFLNSNINLEYLFKDEISLKQKILISGIFSVQKKSLLFKGNLNSEYIDLNKLLPLDLFSLDKNNGFFLVTNDLSPDTQFLINIDGEVGKIKFLDHITEQCKFNININENKLIIRDFQSSYLNSNLNLNSQYSFKSKVLDNFLNLENLKLPKIENNSKYSLEGGIFDASASFKISLRKNNKNFLENINAKGTLNVENLFIDGVDIDKITKKIENLQSISDIFSLLNSLDESGKTLVNNVNLNFSIANGILYVDDCVSKKKDLVIFTEGEYKLIEKYLNFKNTIKLKINNMDSLPNFDVNVFGKIDEIEIKYDFEKFKEKVFNQGLNKLMKENNNLIIIPNEILKLFKKENF